MMIMDGSKTGKADPAFEAHTSVAQHWAQAVWNTWLPTDDLQASIDYARGRIEKCPQPWAVVTGPAAALICTLERLRWKVISAVRLITDEGKEVDLRVTPPIVIKRMVEAAVRRWRWRNVAEAHPCPGRGLQLRADLHAPWIQEERQRVERDAERYAQVCRRQQAVPAEQMLLRRLGAASQMHLLLARGSQRGKDDGHHEQRRAEGGKSDHAHKASETHGGSREPPASGKAVGKGRARRERLASGTEPHVDHWWT